MSNVLAVANIRNILLHLVNYDGEIEAEQAALREFLDIPNLDIASNWHLSTASRL